LRVSELVGFDAIEQYLPHRVAMQFGMDHDVPSSKRLNPLFGKTTAGPYLIKSIFQQNYLRQMLPRVM
jgi:hypothetical protein